MAIVFNYLKALVSVLLCLVLSFPAIIVQERAQREKNIASQNERLSVLEQSYASGSYKRIDENDFADFDTGKAGDVRLNEVSYIATHNSYQLSATPAYTKLYDDLHTVTFGLVRNTATRFSSDDLTSQLNLGIRSLELDIETKVDGGSVSFICSHKPVFNMSSNCYDFAKALREIKMWSDANPSHLPLTMIIEPKKVFMPEKGMRYFNLEYAKKLDELLIDVFGEKLITPAKMMGDYSSLREMRENNGWMTLREAAGHVMVLLHDTGVTEKYIKRDLTMRTQAMFPMLRYKSRDESYASFLLVNQPDDAEKYGKELTEKGIIFRTLIDKYGSHPDEAREKAFASGAQIISTDYPPKTDMTGVEYFVSFPGGKTMRLNSTN